MEATEREAGGWQRHALTATLGALVVFRIIYHSRYLRDVPFGLATFSDGRQYELAARDILLNFPLGSEPFYLQGIYAYVLALPMLIRPWVAMGLLFQLALASLTLWGFYRLATRCWGQRDGGWTTVILLAYPMLAFYENKFLTASLAVTACVVFLLAAVWGQDRPSPWRAALLGASTGLAVLVRPNFALLVPFAIAVVWPWSAQHRVRTVGALVLGLVVSLVPMAIRNHVVTARATVFPAHGGGTSFYIGNNKHARGVWNSAGGLLSGDVSRERSELIEALAIEPASDAQTMAEIGQALYRRGAREIREDPSHWLWLEVRKVWLTFGNEELTQDYDLQGERELIGLPPWVGVPFGVLMVLGGLGLGVLWRRREEAQQYTLLMACGGLAAATLSANLLFFTSSQHRLPLVIPAALLALLGIRWVVSAAAQRRYLALAMVGLLAATTFVPRSRKRAPSAVHYYNLAIAYLAVDLPHEASDAMDRAVQLRGDHPVMLVERATLRRKLGHYDPAREDLDRLDALTQVPAWVRERAERERRLIGTLKEVPDTENLSPTP